MAVILFAETGGKRREVARIASFQFAQKLMHRACSCCCLVELYREVHVFRNIRFDVSRAREFPHTISSDRSLGLDIAPFLEKLAQAFIIAKGQKVNVLWRHIHFARPA
jgi:hypothetical protein